MRRAIKCTGYVLMGIVGATIAASAIMGLFAALLWAADATARWFELPDKYGFLFFIGYVVALAGGVVGASMCRESSRSSQHGAPK